MDNKDNNETTNNQNQFGVTTETKSTNIVLFDSGGFKKLILTDVVSEEIGKNEKYNTLTFKFTDLDGVKTFRHTEFEIDATKVDDYAKSMQALNSRIKHLFETYHTFPTAGVGVGATSFKDFFAKIASSFNTHATGKPIYKTEKGVSIPVWGKLVYSKKGDLRFTIYPNFIEKITSTNQNQPITLTIDNRYDTVIQPKNNASPLGGNGIVGGGDGKANDYGF